MLVAKDLLITVNRVQRNGAKEESQAINEPTVSQQSIMNHEPECCGQLSFFIIDGTVLSVLVKMSRHCPSAAQKNQFFRCNTSDRKGTLLSPIEGRELIHHPLTIKRATQCQQTQAPRERDAYK